MPYLRCPNCGLLAHIATGGGAAIECSRCRAGLGKDVRLLPLEESLRHLDPVTAGAPGRFLRREREDGASKLR
jgi:hypothetical protein